MQYHTRPRSRIAAANLCPIVNVHTPWLQHLTRSSDGIACRMGEVAATTNGTAAKAYTVADLKANTTEQSCYLLVHGKVYDVTDFLDEHPGGEHPTNFAYCARLAEEMDALQQGMLCAAVMASFPNDELAMIKSCCVSALAHAHVQLPGLDRC